MHAINILYQEFLYQILPGVVVYYFNDLLLWEIYIYIFLAKPSS